MDRYRKYLVIGIVPMFTLGLMAAVWIWDPGGRRTSSSAAPSIGGDFTLQSGDGPVSLREMRGQAVLIYFGFTFCPDVCPTSLVAIAQALSSLSPDERERVRALFISVDPERDTPQRVKEYAAFFHPRIIGLTGSPEAIAEVARRYRVFYQKQDVGSAGGYLVDHASWTQVVGPDGKLCTALPHGMPPPEIVRAVRACLGNVL